MNEPVSNDALLLRFLSTNDAACPACGYNLRSLGVPACPECNAALALGVRAPSLRLGPWFAAGIVLAMGAGFDLVILVVVGLVMAWNGGPPRGAWPRLMGYGVVLLSLGIGSMVVVVAHFRHRRRWMTARAQTAWRLAAIYTAVTFVLHAVAGLWIGGII